MSKKTLEIIMSVVMLVVIYFLAVTTGDRESFLKLGKNKEIVVIDAGHGGSDPGKVGVNNSLEKDLNLIIALKIKENLSSEGIEVVMTRNEDKGLYKETDSNKKRSDMNRRCEIINDSGAMLCVSIHQNSFSSSSVKGAQAFYFEGSKEGEELACAIQKSLGNERKAKGNTDYYILLNSDCPSVIVECGFLSNPEEAELLTEDKYQTEIAKAISKGIITYIKKK